MDNLEQVSDEELRRRLLQYGLPNMPVTITTRKILIKKLRLVMEGEKAKLKRQTTLATRYSSDEESDNNSSRTRPASRSTVSYNSRSKPQTPSSSAFARPSPVAAQSNPLAANRRFTAPRSPPQQPTTLRAVTANRSPVYVSPLIQGSSEDSDEDEDYDDDLDMESNASQSYNNNLANENLFSTHLSYGTQQLHNGRSQDDSPAASPYLSDFTQRLLNLRGTTVQSETSPRRQTTAASPTYARSSFIRPFHRSRYTHAPDANDGITYQASTPHDSSSNANRSTAKKAFSSITQKFEDYFGVKQSLVPCLLNTGLLLFFVLVAIAYLAINPNLANTIRVEDATYTPCPIGFSTDVVNEFNCIHRADLEPAIDLLRQTATELQRRAEVNRCADATVSPLMSAKELVKRALEASAGHHTVAHIRERLHHLEYLVDANPQWAISNCDAAGKRIGFEDVHTMSELSENHFAILQPRLPLKCRVYNKMQTFFTIVGSLALVGIVGYAIYWLYKLVVGIRRARKDKVDFLIADIIQALIEKSSTAGPDPDSALIVVNHLRDQLIAPAERAKSAWAWRAAIAFLEANESRIHFEVGTRNGEDFRLMRWSADPSLHSPRSSLASPNAGGRSPGATPGSSKKWHCPAFDKSNKIKDPPTPCLKIRHMFDSNETVTPALRQSIQDAILEKVADTGCRIYDIELETSSCCVYVRCASASDAGIVHEQINGWWFDSRLVSIKFLHLDRYLSRFPNSPAGPKTLQPSNTHNLSMSACYTNGSIAGSPSGSAGGRQSNAADEY